MLANDAVEDQEHNQAGVERDMRIIVYKKGHWQGNKFEMIEIDDNWESLIFEKKYMKRWSKRWNYLGPK